MSDEIIKVKGLSKDYRVKEQKGFFKDLFNPSFKEIKAVNNISFTINKGELMGFIGPNGAGKTTTIKILVGILWPTKGDVLVDNLVPYKDRIPHLMNIGVVFGQRRTLWPELSIKDNLDLISSFYKISAKDFKRRLSELNKLIPVDEFVNQPFRKLSLGQQMRAELIAALLHKPKILFLDEPTVGMDVIAKMNFIKLLKDLNRIEKTTILLTSHDMHEIEDLCKRIIIINKGVIVYDGDFSEIKPQKFIVEYKHAGEFMTKVMSKEEIRDFMQKADLEHVVIKELPITEVIKEFYK